MKTVFITGASKGIGYETALKFANENYNVVATMRNKKDAKELSKMDNVLVTTLDVTNTKSITKSVDKAIKKFGGIDILINNAGYGVFSVFEYTNEKHWYDQMEVNFFGVLRTTQQILPYLRKSDDAQIINISSIGGLSTFPGGSLYHASKFAIEGWTESLYYDLVDTNIEVKLVEPGGIKTDWGGSSLNIVGDDNNEKDYKTITSILRRWKSTNYEDAVGTTPSDCATKIFKFSNKKNKMRQLIGSDAKQVLFAKKRLGAPRYQKLSLKVMSSMLKKNDEK